MAVYVGAIIFGTIKMMVREGDYVNNSHEFGYFAPGTAVIHVCLAI